MPGRSHRGEAPRTSHQRYTRDTHVTAGDAWVRPCLQASLQSRYYVCFLFSILQKCLKTGELSSLLDLSSGIVAAVDLCQHALTDLSLILWVLKQQCHYILLWVLLQTGSWLLLIEGAPGSLCTFSAQSPHLLFLQGAVIPLLEEWSLETQIWMGL